MSVCIIELGLRVSPHICDITTDHCPHCGWNPAVREVRLEKVRAELQAKADEEQRAAEQTAKEEYEREHCVKFVIEKINEVMPWRDKPPVIRWTNSLPKDRGEVDADGKPI